MKRRYKQLLIGILFGNITLFAFSQQAATEKYKLSLAPASPEAAMLFKFSEIPVSK